MKKLYVMVMDEFYDERSIIPIVAENKEKAIDEFVELYSDTHFEEVKYCDDLDYFFKLCKGHEKELFTPLSNGDYDQFKQSLFRNSGLKEWHIIEYAIKEGQDCYIIYDRDEPKVENVFVVYANSEPEARHKAALNMAVDHSKSDNLRVHVTEKVVNFSINESFWKVDGQYCFNQYCDSDTIYAPHVYIKYRGKTEEEIHKLVDEEYEKNVREFFKENKEYGQIFIDYANGKEVNFTDDFFYFVAVKLLESGDWVNFGIKKVSLNGVEALQ